MTETAKQPGISTPRRQDRLIRELDHDPYHAKRKIKGAAACPDCGAVYADGRWSWDAAPGDATEHPCPACRRIADQVPAAFVTLRGDFFTAHRDEIMNLVRNYEKRERMEHPLKRIMSTEEQTDGVVISLCDAHLARGIGEALHRAYEGELDYQYTKDDIMLRVTWTR